MERLTIYPTLGMETVLLFLISIGGMGAGT